MSNGHPWKHKQAGNTEYTQQYCLYVYSLANTSKNTSQRRGGRGTVRKKGGKVKNGVIIDLNEIKHCVSLCVYMHVHWVNSCKCILVYECECMQVTTHVWKSEDIFKCGSHLFLCWKQDLFAILPLLMPGLLVIKFPEHLLSPPLIFPEKHWDRKL